MKIDTRFFPKEMTSDLAEETGLHLGDGSMNYYNGKGLYQLRGHLIDDKPHYLLRIKPLYKRLFNIDVSLRDMSSTGVHGFQIWSDELVDFKKKFLGLPLGPKHDFLVPSVIAENDNFSKSFLRGYFDTDGCLYLENKRGKIYPRIEMYSVSERFIRQLQEVLIRLGFRVTCEKRDNSRYGWSDGYRLSIRGIEMTKKWFLDIKPKNPKHIIKFEKLIISLSKN